MQIMWDTIATHAAAAIFGFASSALLILIKRKRTKAVNGVRRLTTFFCKHIATLEASDQATKLQLAQELRQWMKYPNALGSEANAANLVGRIGAACSLPTVEMAEADLALNALDQRATERERTPAD